MSDIEERVINQIRSRAEAGLTKYGVSLERKDLSVIDWINHTQQELLDGAAYLERLKDEMATLRAENAMLKSAEEALDGRLGNEPEAVKWACEEYVAAEDALPDTFDSEDYCLSKAVASLVKSNSDLESDNARLVGEVETIITINEAFKSK